MKKKTSKIFIISSLIFILGCILFYGYRFYKYYQVFNPKTTSESKTGLLSTEISKNSTMVTSGSGLYQIGGTYVYRGDVDNNYIKFSGFLFRIVKFTYGGSTEIILDQPINSLQWNEKITSYDKSDINAYLNDQILPTLNKKMLTTTSLCLDVIKDPSAITCKNTIEKNTIKLLDVSSFLNSIEEESYLIEDDNLIWLSNISKDQVWHTNGTNLSTSDSNTSYEIRPVVTLDFNTKLLSGKGTINNPYIIEKETKELEIGDYIKLDDDLWQIYDITAKEVKLVLHTLLDKSSAFSTDKSSFDPKDKNSLAYYLNNDYLESLDYSDSILESTWYIGTYNGKYNTIYKKEVKAKIGLLSIADIKLSNEEIPYYLLNAKDEDYIYTYSDSLSTTKKTLSKGIKPAITINNTAIKSGDGTLKSPYVLED